MHCYGITLIYLFHSLGNFEPQKNVVEQRPLLFCFFQERCKLSPPGCRPSLSEASEVEKPVLGAEARPELTWAVLKPEEIGGGSAVLLQSNTSPQPAL